MAAGVVVAGVVVACVAGRAEAVTGSTPKAASKGTAPGGRHARPRPLHRAAENGAAAPYPGRCDAPALIAHRGETGDGAHLPENTWQAELAAVAEGVTYLNMDVRWTSDGVPVALHDATVNRTTSEARPHVPITALTARQYIELDARDYVTDTTSGRVNPNVHPDTLAEALAQIAPTGKPIVLQMEADPYRPAEAGATPGRDFADLAQVIQNSHYADRVIIAGWTLADLRAFHAVAPNVALAYLFESIGAKNLPTAQELTAADTHILYLDYRGVTAAEVSSWRAQGLQIWAWTPAERTQWQELSGDGVQAIATNWSKNYMDWALVPCPADSSD